MTCFRLLGALRCYIDACIIYLIYKGKIQAPSQNRNDVPTSYVDFFSPSYCIYYAKNRLLAVVRLI